jgi:hypothetical protein
MTQAVRAQSIVVKVQEVPPPSFEMGCYDDQPPTAADHGTVVVLAQLPEPPRTAPRGCAATKVHGIEGFLCTRPAPKYTSYGAFISAGTGVVVTLAAPSSQDVQRLLGSIEPA